MSRENVELVRAINEAYNSGDYDAVFRLIDEDVEWVEAPGGLNVAAYRGHEGVRASLVGWVGTFGDTYRYDVEDYTDLGEHVLVSGRQSGRGRASGIEVSELLWMLWTVRDGKAVRMRMFRDRTEALEAAAQG
jgi:ketosteroid isomerase-like protein